LLNKSLLPMILVPILLSITAPSAFCSNDNVENDIINATFQESERPVNQMMPGNILSNQSVTDQAANRLTENTRSARGDVSKEADILIGQYTKDNKLDSKGLSEALQAKDDPKMAAAVLEKLTGTAPGDGGVKDYLKSIGTTVKEAKEVLSNISDAALLRGVRGELWHDELSQAKRSGSSVTVPDILLFWTPANLMTEINKRISEI